MRCRVLLTVAVLTCAPLADVRAQRTEVFDTSYFGGLTFRNVGPNRGGRSIAVAGSSARPNEYYFGATGGGVWKTTDGGTNWRAHSCTQFKSSSAGAIGVCEANPDVVYAGMGEVQLRGNVMQGDGVYKTTDAGATWSNVGLNDSHAIGRVRVHPTNCDIAYAAVLGHTFGPNAERGVFKTTDGGRSWQRVLHRDDQTGAVDLVLDPSDPDVLYAGFWQVHRTPWSLSSGGPGSGLFKSTDAGKSWTELTHNAGLPKGTWGKVGVSVSGADPKRVYAIIEARDGGVFRSDDAGATWTRTNEERKLRQRAFYYTRIYADRQDKDLVYVLNVGFHKSTDGGKTFPKAIRVPHGDNHDLWIAANDNQRMVEGNDGGGNVSVNGGQSWTDQDYPTAQLYHITTTNHQPYWVCGAQQDNSTACMRSGGWPQMAPHVAVGGGESGYIASDPENPNIFYAGSYGGYLTRYDYATGQSQIINVWPENPMGHSSGEIRERFQWTFPIVFSRTGPRKLYVGSQHLWVTTSEGKSWQKISPDLTRHDPKTMGPSGGPITLDQTGVETYGTIFTIAPSPHDAKVIWTGSDDGYVFLTRDGGANWTNVTPKDLPEFARISMIDVSPHRPGTVYVAAKRYQLDDRAPYIYRSDDYGKTWIKTVNGIGAADYVHVVREDPVRERMLFAGTEHGLYISFDNGAQWQRFNRNLPDVQVSDLAIKDHDLVIGTHGRSAYVMDDITPLRQLNARLAGAPVVLFQPADAHRGLDQSVAFTYHLKQPAKKLTIEILDETGPVVRMYDSVQDSAAKEAGEEDDDDDDRRRRPRPPLKAGSNRFSWDMRSEPAVRFPGMILWAAGTNGPRVLPGRYQVRLTVDAHAPVTQSFQILTDPRAQHVTMADLRAQHELALQVRNRLNQANEAVMLIRGIREQIDERVESANDPKLADLAGQLKEKLSKVEAEIYQVRNQSSQDPLNYPIRLNNKIAALLGAAEGVAGRPTAQAHEVFNELGARLDQQLAWLNGILERDLPSFNRVWLEPRGLPPIEKRMIAAE
ncbi:MAG: WD40/YVTN/BNR-like repeat-containing protein [Gemmatimonadota bacterium]